MASASDSLVHLVSGGVGGTIGAVVTCPLEVLKTRLQSSGARFSDPPVSSDAKTQQTGATSRSQSSSKYSFSAKDPTKYSRVPSTIHSSVVRRPSFVCFNSFRKLSSTCITGSLSSSAQHSVPLRLTIIHCTKYIYRTEGIPGFFKGLVPNVVGVAPSRAIYFSAYSSVKSNEWLNERLGYDTPTIHMLSAGTAGFINTSLTNPLWLVKTRLQLDQLSGSSKMTIAQCVRRAYAEGGIRIFWKGVTASYAGISETMLHFVLYEKFKAATILWIEDNSLGRNSVLAYTSLMLCGGLSKFIAGICAYPHEVARTRLREERSRYRGFFHCLATVRREDGLKGWYRGLFVHLLRQVPNTAIMLMTYEIMVHLLTKTVKPPTLDTNLQDWNPTEE